jgi:Mycotoxin biosynthesis protein UstYa
MHDSPYVGPPSAPLDMAWQSLLANMSIRVSKAELERHGQNSVALPEGGHLAWLGVFHQLHCVVSVMTFVHSFIIALNLDIFLVYLLPL